jgi:hypothetical protein
MARWFAENDWVLGSDFVRVLDERAIDTENVADYLVEAYDGFLDIIEIKRPGGRPALLVVDDRSRELHSVDRSSEGNHASDELHF